MNSPSTGRFSNEKDPRQAENLDAGRRSVGRNDKIENTKESPKSKALPGIPNELKMLRQWVCFDVADDGKKVPYIPGTNSFAASSRPKDWRSFDDAVKDVESGKRQHVGFVFNSTDPYVFIDLDDPDDADVGKIFNRLDSYAQRSVSGEGAHIICRGRFEGSGKHPKFPAVGLFQDARLCLMTGDVIDDRSEIKEVSNGDLQAIHTWLSKGTKSAGHEDLVEYESELPDQTVFDLGCGMFPHKYLAMSNGNWEQFEEFHGDHSTADHAFLAMLCDITESNDQVRELFHMSGMWNDARAAKKAGHGFKNYVDRSIQKIRSKQTLDEARSKDIIFEFGAGDESTPERFQNGFPTVRCSDIVGSMEALDFVQGLLVVAAMSVVYGPSNCGKSFWALYLAACVAMGIPFFGREVERGAVLYFGLEGRSGAHNRVSAMKHDGFLLDDAPLYLCFSPLSLLDKGHAEIVAATVSRIEREEGCKMVLIVIDTYARAMAGGDENSGKDTSEVVATVDAIRAKSSAHVMLIHHCGKNEALGARGHSSLRAATDTEIEITRPDAAALSVVTIKKQRDLSIDGPHLFKLVPVELGKDRRGEPITSCIVRHEKDANIPSRKQGRPKKATENALLDLLPQPSTTAWQKKAEAERGISQTRFYEERKLLVEQGKAIPHGNRAWQRKFDFREEPLKA